MFSTSRDKNAFLTVQVRYDRKLITKWAGHYRYRISFEDRSQCKQKKDYQRIILQFYYRFLFFNISPIIFPLLSPTKNDLGRRMFSNIFTFLYCFDEKSLIPHTS